MVGHEPGIVMKRILIGVCAILLAASSRAWADAPTSQPSNTELANELQIQANEDMGRGNYAAAAVLLQKVEQLVADQPDVLGLVMEDLRVCRKQVLQQNSNNPQQSVVTAVDGAGPRHIHPTPAAGQTLEMPIKELGNFDYDATNGGNIPTDVTHLEGCQFRTKGFMIPLDQAESISEFALVPSLVACCFGQPPQIQHTIIVTCPKDKAVAYFPDELIVEGKLHVKEMRDGGFIVSIFQMDATDVRAAPQ
jgi:hypothetical protein